jgi:hypothetical protein
MPAISIVPERCTMSLCEMVCNLPMKALQFFSFSDTDEKVGRDFCLHARRLSTLRKTSCMTICPTSAEARP